MNADHLAEIKKRALYASNGIYQPSVNQLLADVQALVAEIELRDLLVAADALIARKQRDAKLDSMKTLTKGLTG